MIAKLNYDYACKDQKCILEKHVSQHFSLALYLINIIIILSLLFLLKLMSYFHYFFLTDALICHAVKLLMTVFNT